jgi:hypothetical protein
MLAKLVEKFAASVIDTGGKFAAGVVDTGSAPWLVNCWHGWQILPPVSTMLAKLVEKFAASVIDTGGKFAAGVVDTGSAPWLVNISANLLKKFHEILWGWGEADSWKNQKQKILWHCPFQ